MLINSCSKTKRETVTIPAFYHWKTKLEISDFEIRYLDSLKVSKLYIKFFDVDWDYNLQNAYPQAVVQFDDYNSNYQIIPTIFITNRTLIEIDVNQLPELASKIIQKIKSTAVSEITEIQIDCDWSPSTEKKYFKLLKLIRQEKKEIQLSATIRLHQVKYAKQTGVPPIDKGMLMFYNMGEVSEVKTTNSILDLNIAQQYLYNFEAYPIPLDVALPLFSWSVLFRDGEMIKLLTNVENELEQDTTRFEKVDATHFKVKKSTYLNGYYLYKEDQLRIEKIKQEDLLACGEILKAHLNNQSLTISFYHLDSTILNTFSYDFLEEVCHQFH